MLSLIFYGIGTALFGIGTCKFWEAQKIENTPTSKIRALAIGQVEVKGKATGRVIESPLSKTKCVAYMLVYKELKPNGTTSELVTKLDYSKEVFQLEDQTGKVDLDVNSMFKENGFEKEWLDVKPSYKDVHSENEDLESEVKLYLGPQAEEKRKLWSSFEERCIMPGQDLYVMGLAKRKENAHSTSNVGDLVITSSSEFLVSSKGESPILGKLKRQAIGVTALGIGVLILALAIDLKVIT